MLYPDSEKRKQDIDKISMLFKNKGYKKTSSEILTFNKIYEENDIPSDFLERLSRVFDILKKEFIEVFPVGKNYRKRCFNNISRIILLAIKKNPSSFSQKLLILHPLLIKLQSKRYITSLIANQLKNNKKIDKIFVHQFFYSYLIIVEGIFDELARMLYYLKTMSDNQVPSFSTLEKMRVWDILGKFKTTPVFLENWEEKNHIRNAIGHASAFYDETKQEVHFEDIYKDKTWKKTYHITIFIEKALELESSVRVFLYIFLLLRIYDLVLSPNPYST